MSGIYIHGIEMPKDPFYPSHATIYADGSVITGHGIGHSVKKAVPVPPHGRLIDADALVAEFHRLTLGENSLIEKFFADGVYAVIDNASTIIPAEEGE